MKYIVSLSFVCILGNHKLKIVRDKTSGKTMLKLFVTCYKANSLRDFLQSSAQANLNTFDLVTILY